MEAVFGTLSSFGAELRGVLSEGWLSKLIHEAGLSRGSTRRFQLQ
jgi:hypothetical protein